MGTSSLQNWCIYMYQITYDAGDNVMLTLYNVSLTSQNHGNTVTRVIIAKQTVINEVYIFSRKYRYSNIY